MSQNMMAANGLPKIIENGIDMTLDNIQTRRYYHRMYGHWPAEIIAIHLLTIDAAVEEMHPDEMIEARALMDMKIPTWK